MKKILLGICIAAMLLTIPSIYSRVMTEEPNKTVETAMPYLKIQEWLIENPELTADDVHERLKANGVDSLAVEPDSLESLEKRGLITVVTVKNMKEFLVLNQKPSLEPPFNKDGVFVYLQPNAPMDLKLSEAFLESQSINVEGTPYTFIPGSSKDIMKQPVGYDHEMIGQILEDGFNVIPRIGDYADPEVMEYMTQQLVELKQDGIQTVIFNGSTVPYGTMPGKQSKFANELKESGYAIGLIEFNEMIGFNRLAYLNDLNVVRLLSRKVTESAIQDEVNVYVRAFKERNIRMAFVNLEIKDYEEAMTALEKFNNELEATLPGAFTRGQAITLDKVEQPFWQKIVGLIGLVAFLGFAAEVVFKRRKLTYIGLAGLSLIALVYLITGVGILLKALVLGLAIAAPIAAVLLPRDPSKKGYLIKSYAATIATVMLGVWFVVVLMHGNDYFLGINHFKGVNLVYSVPIAFLAIYTLWESISKLLVLSWKNIGKILKSSIAYWHVIALGAIGLFAIFYLGRGGNQGVVIPYELEFRLWLEQVLYIRPRTKEFLIGLPLLVLALHVAKTHVKTSYYLLIPAVIGVLSIMNTFTHFHIPLSVSLLRTSYSVVLGFLIGLVFIVIYEYLKKVILREWDRKRWVC
ncbi:hypothetical protein CQS04_06975 [Chryseomicrobium excrementi]|uniref:Uncharacterized protein n=1 Tax=Chryseomicrobium excrementi TaxID=2041346 RepID=A0A2M9F099_9BACL|nr:DUF5693 family protein [Chryseomicrobium excrementi]PJK16888.1 hypothetical protein CQS04_06975 [Chryseomicrobium excrementi]